MMKRKVIKVVGLLFISMMFVGCYDKSYQKNISKEHVTIFFTNVNGVPNIQTTPTNFYTTMKAMRMTDTIAISKVKYEELKRILQKKHRNMQVNNNLETVMCLLYKKQKLFIGRNELGYDINGFPIDVSLHEIYFIKVISGYYNHFRKYDLDMLQSVRKYGLPQNYKNLKDLPGDITKYKSPYSKIYIYERES